MTLRCPLRARVQILEFFLQPFLILSKLFYRPIGNELLLRQSILHRCNEYRPHDEIEETRGDETNRILRGLAQVCIRKERRYSKSQGNIQQRKPDCGDDSTHRDHQAVAREFIGLFLDLDLQQTHLRIEELHHVLSQTSE